MIDLDSSIACTLDSFYGSSVKSARLFITQSRLKMAEGKHASAGKSGPGGIARSYLTLYNASLCLGWTLVLFGSIRYVASGRVSSDWITCPGLYASVRKELLLAQSAAVLEVGRILSVPRLGSLVWVKVIL